jgi:hypothetical protein
MLARAEGICNRIRRDKGYSKCRLYRVNKIWRGYLTALIIDREIEMRYHLPVRPDPPKSSPFTLSPGLLRLDQNGRMHIPQQIELNLFLGSLVRPIPPVLVLLVTQLLLLPLIPDYLERYVLPAMLRSIPASLPHEAD